jgi:ribonuclease-3
LTRNNTSSENIKAIEEIFDLKIKDTSLYHLSLVHRSSSIESADNERLELLGDAVLDLVVVDHLYRLFPDLDEGKLTKLKSKIVSREHLSALAIQLGLVERLSLVKQKELSPELLIGNVLEAIFGAIYLEQGFEIAQLRALKMIEDHIGLDSLFVDLVDAKSKLLEQAQKNKWNIVFSVKEESRESEYRFSARVKYGDRILGQGKGSSKKKAEKSAAAQALKTLQEENQA